MWIPRAHASKTDSLGMCNLGLLWEMGGRGRRIPRNSWVSWTKDCLRKGGKQGKHPMLSFDLHVHATNHTHNVDS